MVGKNGFQVIVDLFNEQKTENAKSKALNAKIKNVYEEVVDGETSRLRTEARRLRTEKDEIAGIAEVSFTVTEDAQKPIVFKTDVRGYNTRIKKYECDLGNLKMEIDAFEKLYKAPANVDLSDLA